jgi:mRNA interferase MazF
MKRGDIYWLQTESDIAHPHVVIQDNAPDNTVTVCAVTSNMKKISVPGNVLLEAGEANLTRGSVVEVSKAVTVDKVRLGAYIGSLTEARMKQIAAGMRLVQSSYFDR